MEQKNIIQKIKKSFIVPERVADKIKNIVEKARGGWVLIETRPQWDDAAGPWTRLPFAKIIFHQPSQEWRLYWMRASGKWQFYGQYKTLDKTLKTIKEDKNCCFWG